MSLVRWSIARNKMDFRSIWDLQAQRSRTIDQFGISRGVSGLMAVPGISEALSLMRLARIVVVQSV